MKILDPEFSYHLALSRLWALMAVGLADAKVQHLASIDICNAEDTLYAD